MGTMKTLIGRVCLCSSFKYPVGLYIYFSDPLATNLLCICEL